MSNVDLTRAGTFILLDVFFDKEIGRVELGKGSIRWFGKNKQKPTQIPWSKFSACISHIAVILCTLLILLPVVASSKDNGYTIKYDGGSVTEVKSGSDLRLYIDANQIRFVRHKEEVLVIPPTAITEISYGQDVHRRVGTAGAVGVFTLGVGSLVALRESTKHFVGLTWANGEQKGGLAMQCDKSEYRGILAGIEGITGKKAVDSTTITAVAFGQTDSQKSEGGLSKANWEQQPFTVRGQALEQGMPGRS